LNDTTKFAGWQCPSYGLAHDSPCLGDLPQGSSAYVEGTIPVRVFSQTTSGTLEQSAVPAATHTDCPASPTPLRGVGFAHFNHRDSSPVRLVLDVLPKFPEWPRVQLSVESPALAVFSDAFWIPDCDEGVCSLRLVHNRLGNLVQLVVRGAALFIADSLHYL